MLYVVQCSFDEYPCGSRCLSYNATFCNGVDDCTMDGFAIDELACTGKFIFEIKQIRTILKVEFVLFYPLTTLNIIMLWI